MFWGISFDSDSFNVCESNQHYQPRPLVIFASVVSNKNIWKSFTIAVVVISHRKNPQNSVSSLFVQTHQISRQILITITHITMPWILISKKGGTISCPRQFLQLKKVVHYRTYYSTLKKSELAFYRNYLLPTIYKNRHKLEKMDMTYINSKHFLPEILNF